MQAVALRLKSSDVWWQAGAILLFAGLISVWDILALDLSVSQWFGNSQGFALRTHWFWQRVLHDAIRWPAWAAIGFFIWLSMRGAGTALKRDARWALGGALIAVLAVQWLKRNSATSCPWDLQVFGGVAHYVPHWVWGLRDGGPGRCFPSGHACVAFGFLPVWAVFKRHLQWPKWVLAGLILAGIALGGVQVLRGAHFVSHVLWSGWVCTVVAVVMFWTREMLRETSSQKFKR